MVQLNLESEVRVTRFTATGLYVEDFMVSLPGFISNYECRTFLNETLSNSYPNSKCIFVSLDVKNLGFPYLKIPITEEQLT